MEFGLRVPSFPVDGSRGSKFIRQIMSFIGELEASFDSAWISDHLVPWATFQDKRTDTLECFTTICYLSGIFTTMDFGSIVLCNSYRNPALLAKMGATLQTLTGGRFILGLGAGWKRDEYEAYGYPFPSPAVRIGQLEEGVQIIRRMWTEDGVTFKGRYFRVEGAYCNPKPRPPPPMMIGGGGERLTLRVVARHADWWNLPNVSLQTYKRKLSVLREHCAQQRRDFGAIRKTLASMVAIARTESQARRIASESPFVERGREGDYFIGSPGQVRERLNAFVDAGVDYFILRFLDFPSPNGAKLFAEEVIPDLR